MMRTFLIEPASSRGPYDAALEHFSFSIVLRLALV
jgi:hypothetical protein